MGARSPTQTLLACAFWVCMLLRAFKRLPHIGLLLKERTAANMHGVSLAFLHKQNGHSPTNMEPRKSLEDKSSSRTYSQVPCGCGSKSNRRGYAGFGPCFHLPGFHFGTRFVGHLCWRVLPNRRTRIEVVSCLRRRPQQWRTAPTGRAMLHQTPRLG